MSAYQPRGWKSICWLNNNAILWPLYANFKGYFQFWVFELYIRSNRRFSWFSHILVLVHAIPFFDGALFQLPQFAEACKGYG